MFDLVSSDDSDDDLRSSVLSFLVFTLLSSVESADEFLLLLSFLLMKLLAYNYNWDLLV